VYCVEGTRNCGSSGTGLGRGWPKFKGMHKRSIKQEAEKYGLTIDQNKYKTHEAFKNAN
jgi:hypothetical protein